MPALAPYIPNKDAQYNNWLANFAALIAAAPLAYGLTSTDATNISAAEAAWAAAYALVTSPSTKTKDTVQAKNTARIVSLATVRPYAQTIVLNPAVSSANKIALGLNPRTSTPAPITAPTTYPILSVPTQLPLQAVIYYRDQLASPSVKAKPYGVVQVQLFATASATPITDPALLHFVGVRTKSPTTLSFDSAQAGMKCYLAGRWVTRTGLVGPYGPIISLTIA